MAWIVVVLVVLGAGALVAMLVLRRSPRLPREQAQRTSTGTVPPAHPDPGEAPPGSAPRRDH